MTDNYGCTLHGATIRPGAHVLVNNPARLLLNMGIIRKTDNPPRTMHVGYIEVEVAGTVQLFCPCELYPPARQEI